MPAQFQSRRGHLVTHLFRAHGFAQWSKAVSINLTPPFGGKLRAFGVAWFRPEDYQRIREISHDDMIPTFQQWEAKMTKFLAEQQTPPGVILEKVIVNPDELLAFAKR